MIPKLTQYIFQTKTYYSQMRERSIILPDKKKKLKVRSVHPWTEYKTTSKTLDLAIIVLSKGFQLSKMLPRNSILDKIFLDGVKDPPDSMSIDCKVASSRPVCLLFNFGDFCPKVTHRRLRSNYISSDP